MTVKGFYMKRGVNDMLTLYVWEVGNYGILKCQYKFTRRYENAD